MNAHTENSSYNELKNNNNNNRKTFTKHQDKEVEIYSLMTRAIKTLALLLIIMIIIYLFLVKMYLLCM